ncbi:proline-rich nuclear receptor coactivator 1 [Bombina bombina]|uniref:proline-rich nuclear receptor coactivator 1 n=1 Tax=Bombina bombina TaxID=8345 RepID=UPI00235A9E25|nr:proline-rich nuclear receptor coactivator 1 [Bombina bombina]
MTEPGGGRGNNRRRRGFSKARMNGRKNKIRNTPFPIRGYHNHYSIQGAARDNTAMTASPCSVDNEPVRAAQYRQFRRETKKKVGKCEKRIRSEKSSIPHTSTAHRSEQLSLPKQKSKGNTQHAKTNSPKKIERLQAESNLVSNGVRRPDKKPLTSSENYGNLKQENSTKDVKEKKINYAGARFSDPPSPSVLPKPPSHWFGNKGQHFDQCKEQMAFQLKTLLKVHL